MACRQIKNEENNIKNPIRLTIVSCHPDHLDSKMSICYRNTSIDDNPASHIDTFPINFRIHIGNGGGLLHQFRLAPEDGKPVPRFLPIVRGDDGV
jgi:hypothetical protein